MKIPKQRKCIVLISHTRQKNVKLIVLAKLEILHYILTIKCKINQKFTLLPLHSYEKNKKY